MNESTKSLATRTRRCLAAILDAALVLITTGIVLLVSGVIETAEAYGADGYLELRILAAGIVAYLLLHGFLMISRGQTLGKLICGIKIVNANTDTERPAIWVVIIRAVLNPICYVLLPGVLVWLILVDHLPIVLKQRRCLHDWILKTDVVPA